MRESAKNRVGDLFGQAMADDLAPLVAAAHELKTPLSVVAYLAAALRDPNGDLTPAQTANYLERISLATERMNRLVEGFTQAYRLGSDGNQLSLLGLEPVNISQISQEVAQELQPLARQLDQTIELKVHSRSNLVVANRQMLSSVMINLMDNALKHNEPGTDVHVNISQHGNYIRAGVQDNGANVTRHDLLRLRGRFGKELQPLSGRSHSSGLGLYIASQLTRAMGGNLGAICHHKTGTTFYADLQRSTQLSLI